MSQPAKVDCATGSIAGAGSTFVGTIVQQWIKDYSAACAGATVNYQGVGSGAGVQQFTAGTVDFGASDVPLTTAEKGAAEAKRGHVLQIPWSAGGVAVEYKLQGVDKLKLSPATLAGIFAGKINKWNDAAIKSDNAGVTLPSTPIQVIHRSDGSGTTAAFTAYLAAVAPTVWTAGTGKDVPWPTGQGAKGSDGVTAAVAGAEGTIGYAELSYAKAKSLSVAQIKNEAGQFVGPDPENVTAALKEAQVGADLTVKMNYKAMGADVYPISTATYVIVPQAPADAAKGKLSKSFIMYALDQGQKAATGLFYASLPDTVTGPAKTAVDGIGAAASGASGAGGVASSTTTSWVPPTSTTK